MATTLVFDEGQQAYAHVVNYVINHGTPREARGLPTLDCTHVTVELRRATRALPLHCGRRLNPAIGALEAIQLIGGFSDPDLCVRVAPNFQRYRETSGEFHGAYGRRIGNQLSHVLRKLRDDPDTRQAIISLWDPFLDNQPGRLDYPCTIALRFSIVNHRLELDVLMRSNDVWLGTPYDWFQFTQLQLTVARLLGIHTGTYRHTAWSLHIYLRDLEVAKLVRPIDRRVSQPVGLGDDQDSLNDVVNLARAIADNTLNGRTLTPSERWYRDQLHPAPPVLQPNEVPTRGSQVVAGQRVELPAVHGGASARDA